MAHQMPEVEDALLYEACRPGERFVADGGQDSVSKMLEDATVGVHHNKVKIVHLQLSALTLSHSYTMASKKLHQGENFIIIQADLCCPAVGLHGSERKPCSFHASYRREKCTEWPEMGQWGNGDFDK